MVLARRPWPRQRKLWLHLAVTAAVGCVIPFLLFAWAAERIPSGVSSVLNSAVPLATAAVTAVALRQEKVTQWKAAGILTGAVGILLVLSPWRFYAADAVDLWGQLACLGAVLCFGVDFAYTKKYVSPHPADPVGVAAVQMVAACLMVLVMAPFIALGPVTLTVPVLVGMLLLGVVSTGLAYVWNFRIIAPRWGCHCSIHGRLHHPAGRGGPRCAGAPRGNHLEPARRRRDCHWRDCPGPSGPGAGRCRPDRPSASRLKPNPGIPGRGDGGNNVTGPEDFEEIRNLKADYFRHLDAKNWSALRSLLHAEATFGGFPFDTEDADNFVRSVSGFLHDVDSVHQGFMPRLQLPPTALSVDSGQCTITCCGPATAGTTEAPVSRTVWNPGIRRSRRGIPPPQRTVAYFRHAARPDPDRPAHGGPGAATHVEPD